MAASSHRLTLTIPEAAKALGISRGLAYELAKRNALPVPVIRCGRRMVVARRALDELLAGNGAGCGHCQSE